MKFDLTFAGIGKTYLVGQNSNCELNCVLGAIFRLIAIQRIHINVCTHIHTHILDLIRFDYPNYRDGRENQKFYHGI